MPDATEHWQDQDPALAERHADLLGNYVDEGVSDETLRLVSEYLNALLGEIAFSEAELQDPSFRDGIVAEFLADFGFQGEARIASTADAYLLGLTKQKAVVSVEPPQRQRHQAADPVDMFSGQFVHEIEDISVDGAGMDFVFRRVYKHQAKYWGPLGATWDHSYNLWIRQVGTNVVRSSGALREDVYTRHPKFGQAGFDYWVSPAGVKGVIVERNTSLGVSFVWRSAEGIRCHYVPDPSNPTVHLAERIEDRFGNHLALAYDPNVPGRLARVLVNHPNRVVTFDYDPQGRIERIRDYTGRSWHYAYDDLSDLVAFTLPATAQYPAGSTVYYEYTSGAFAGNLQHNLLRIIDPAGRVYVENEYGADEGLVNYNKVVRQRLGQGESSFEYEQVVNEFGYSYADAEAPWRQVNFVERNGHPIHYIYNECGNLILKEEYVLEGGKRRLRQWRYRYNSDGALIGMLSPEGSVTQYYYGRDHYLLGHGISDDEVSQHSALTAQERLGFDNLLAMVRRGKRYTLETMNLSRGVWGDFFPDVLATDPEDVVTKYTYEPHYQQILAASDPRFTESADPGHLERASYFATLTQHEYSGPSGDPHRFLARIRYPATTQADGTVQPGAAEQFTQYDPWGRLQRQLDRAGVVTETIYFGASDGIKEGYVKKQTIDPGGLAVTTEFEVNDVGVVTAIHHPRSVGAACGRFVNRFEVNERNQIVRTHASPPFDYVTESLYDPSGLVVRMERDILDETGRPVLGGKEVQTFCYEEQKQVIRHSLGGIDLSSHHVTRHRYDAAATLTATFTPAGGVVRRRYDDRLLERTIVRGSGSPDASTSRAEFDGDGRRSRAISGRDFPTTFRYDALGRIEVIEDALGNRTYLTHDKAGNITAERFFERGAGGSYSLLSRGEYTYDELNRLAREGHNLFRLPIAVGNIRTAYLASPGPGTLIETEYYYDAKGRLIRTVNAKGQSTHARFDALDRKWAEWDHLGNRTETQYDAHGNATRRDLIETLIDPASGQVTGTEVFPTAYQYDELDRLIIVTDSLGNVTRHAYDSRNNLVRTTDPLGNVVRYEYDVHNRKVSELRDLTATGLGNGSAAGTIKTLFEYDGNGNVTGHIDGNGNRIEQRFDALDRRRAVVYPDTTEYQTDYDEDDNIVLVKDNNGAIRRAKFDALGRRFRVDVDRSGVPAGIVIEGENFERCTYDALGRALSEVNDFATVARKVDSLGRMFWESIEVTSPAPASPVRTITRAHDELGAIRYLTYPDGRVIRYDRDGVNRVVKIVNIAKGSAYPGSTLHSDPRDVLRIDYRGLRTGVLHCGNGFNTGYQYDAAGRAIQIEHRDAVGLPILSLQHLYDGVGNMRFRNDIGATGASGERFEYDSIYRLTRIKPDGIATFNPAPFAPATGRPIDPIPPRQTMINARLGSLAQDAANATFAYDSAANRIREQRPALPAVNYVSNALNEYQRVGSVALSYDRNGNLVSDGARQYIYDSRDLLVRVVDSATGAGVARYFHDCLGRRIAEVRGGHVVHLVSDGLNVLEEYEDGALGAQYVHEVRTDADMPALAGRKRLLASQGRAGFNTSA